MDYAGLIGKFKGNRPLTLEEKACHLGQKTRIAVEPHYQLSVIKLNSTYLESVDKWYGRKGFITAIALALILIFPGILGLGIGKLILERGSSGWSVEDQNILLWNGLGMIFFVLLICWPVIWLLRKEAFAYTHYPIRFNRRTRMIHAFRTDGTVLTVPWDEVYFTMKKVDHLHRYSNILGHVLENDGNTVRESFALSKFEIGSPDGLAILRSHWEFVRRYMEDGPDSVHGQVQFCLPISGRRETLTFGIQRLLGSSSSTSPFSLPVLLMGWILDLATVPFRYIAIRTSKIPAWPPEIEAQCMVDPGDPYAISGAPNGDRIAVFPEAAAAAGVQFVAQPGNPLAPAENRGNGVLVEAQGSRRKAAKKSKKQ